MGERERERAGERKHRAGGEQEKGSSALRGEQEKGSSALRGEQEEGAAR